MSEGKYVLAMYDVRGKQDFIFRTNKLQEIVGASWIIRDIFKDYLFPIAKEYEGSKGIYSYLNFRNNPDSYFSENNFKEHVQSEGYIGEVVYEGGGNFILLFKDEDTFKEITYRFTKKIMEDIGTLHVLGTCIKIDNFDNYEEDRKKLYKEHRINEAQESNISPWSCLPIVQVDRKTSQPLVDYDIDKLVDSFFEEWVQKNSKQDLHFKGIKEEIRGKIHKKGVKGKLTKESTAKLVKFYCEIIMNDKKDDSYSKLINFYKNNENILDNLVTEKGTDSQLAVVYIDGNNMGAKVQAATNGLKSYEGSVNALRDFSRETQDIYVVNGVEHALEGLKEKDFRVVVSAGDEINFIVNAHYAFSCAKNYLNYLKKVGNGASACAGIAVFHSHAPYADAYKIAEEACESGKKKMKEAKHEVASYVDFHICQGAIGTSLEEIRKEENGEIISRPWMIWSDGKQGDPSAKVIEYGSMVTKKLGFIKKFARSNVKGLIAASKEGVVPLQMEINRMYGHAKPEDKEKWEKEWKLLMDELGGKCKEVCPDTVRSIIYDITLAYDLWFDKEATEG